MQELEGLSYTSATRPASGAEFRKILQKYFCTVEPETFEDYCVH
jgi:hypothetical protein